MEFKKPQKRDDLRKLLKHVFGTIAGACFSLEISESKMSKILNGYDDPNEAIIEKLKAVEGFHSGLI